MLNWGLKMKSRRRVLRKIVLILLVIIFSLVLIECLLRTIGYYLAKNITPQLDSPEILNADYLIACFGASYTYGIGASSREFSYPMQLERILNERFSAMDICVLNEGLAGNSFNILHRMEFRLVDFPKPPDLIIVMGFANNSWNLYKSTALLEGYADLPDDKQWLARFQKTKIGKFATVFYMGGQPFSQYLAEIEENKWNETRGETILNPRKPEDREFLKKWILYDMQQMKSLAVSQKATIMISMPTNSFMNSLVRECAHEFSLPLCEAPKDQFLWLPYGWLSSDGWHPNDRGYGVYAAHIADCIEGLELLAETPASAQEVTRQVEQPDKPIQHID